MGVLNGFPVKILFASLLGTTVLAGSSPLTGLWDAAVFANNVNVPFRMELAIDGSRAQAYLFDGDQKVPSTSGELTGDKLHLHWDLYDADFDGTVENGQLTGTYVGRRHSKAPRPLPLKAHRFVAPGVPAVPAPSIAGQWELRSEDGKQNWKFFVRQSGNEISGAILRIDGDSGTLSGAFHDGTFVLSHFAGARPALLEAHLTPEGALDATFNGKLKLTGLRTAAARAQGLPEPPDPARYTSVADPSEPFRFRFPNLSGKVVSSDDERFRGKVVIVAIGGSWCPNCNDEAPFLNELYQQYRTKGLEVVSLQFESGDEEYDRKRIRAFAARYGIGYTLLMAGATDEVAAKLPFLTNFSAFPTSFYLGRDGKVRSVHAGFASTATGEEHKRLTTEVRELVLRLLAEKPQSTPTATAMTDGRGRR